MSVSSTISTPRGPIPAGAPSWNRQRHSQMPSHRYRDIYTRVDVPLQDREWPSRRLTSPPLWVPVDLRDGNQALPEPMDPARKRKFFELMVAMGFKEIEVGYPSASQADYDFVRMLVETDLVPPDVTIVVFTPARRDLIERTVASVRGMTKPVVIHMYTATAPTWRDVVLGRSPAEVKDLVLTGGRDVLELSEGIPDLRFEFSPEVFNLTEPDFVVDVCDSMTALWDASPDRPVIINLPSTVEASTPNVYADQVEYMHRSLARRESVILSVHPHNDRGTGVASGELALLAGAERIEGCLFGNGERTGNVDLVTLALNMHSQGIDPMIDFSDIDEIRRVVEHCNQLEVHPRHPYVGDLVHTAFSGTHQDAIRKGFAEHAQRAAERGIPESEAEWRVPYLPVDPSDLGRTYESVIRVNSQSGKGGVAYLLETEYGVELPRRLEIDLARRVQAWSDHVGTELSAAELWQIFTSSYLRDPSAGDPALLSFESVEVEGTPTTTITLRVGADEVTSVHQGVGPVEALATALVPHGRSVEVLGLHQTSVRAGNDSEALTVLEFRTAEGPRWAAAIDRSVLTASLHAVIAAAAMQGSEVLTPTSR